MRGGTAERGFEVASPAVPAELSPFIESWVGYEEWSGGEVARLEYPTGRAVLIFEFGPPLKLGRPDSPLASFSGGFLAGIDDEATQTVFDRRQAGVQVTLTPRGALSLCHSAARSVVALNDLRFGLGDELASASSWTERFAAVTRACRARFVSHGVELTTLVAYALHRFDSTNGSVRIAGLSDELGVSRKHLHSRFTDEVGLSPKRYAALRRFALVLERLKVGGPLDGASLALECGYSDQAHLAREVRRFSSLTARHVGAVLSDPLTLAINRLVSRTDRDDVAHW